MNKQGKSRKSTSKRTTTICTVQQLHWNLTVYAVQVEVRGSKYKYKSLKSYKSKRFVKTNDCVVF